jgi:hypothetical protein
LTVVYDDHGDDDDGCWGSIEWYVVLVSIALVQFVAANINLWYYHACHKCEDGVAKRNYSLDVREKLCILVAGGTPSMKRHGTFLRIN